MTFIYYFCQLYYFRKTTLENFLFQYRTTPRSTTELSPAKLLMGRTLLDKLLKVIIPEDRATEAEWQQLLRERGALHKHKHKQDLQNIGG